MACFRHLSILYKDKENYVLITQIITVHQLRQEAGKIEGNATIDDEFELNGTIVGNATVISGGFFILNGTVTGDLTLRSGAVCVLNGTVGGSVFNRGGDLRVFGYVKGDVRRDGGTNLIDKNAKIGGKSLGPNFH